MPIAVESPPPPPNTKSPLFDFSLILLLIGVTIFMAAAARYYSIFDDEAFSCRRYVLPVADIIPALWHQTEPDPPLYYLSVHAWMRIFGITPLAMRSLSIFCFIAGVIALGNAANIWLGRRTARWTVVLAAIHPLHLFFGFAARWYAMLFLGVALLLLATAKLQTNAPQHRRWSVLWVIAATAMLYTNYFAPTVLGLVILGCLLTERSHQRRRLWLIMSAIVAAFFAPWMPAFYAQLARFPHAGNSASAYFGTAARTAAALLTGNFADPGDLSREAPGAWWVWLPMIAFVLLLCRLLWNRRTTLVPLLLVCGGSFVVGIATLTMIDKYAMAFSGPLVMLFAAALMQPARKDAGSQQLARAALALAWLGCFANLARQADWTSQRWLDPFATMVADVASQARPGDCVIASHPAVGYYWGLHRMKSEAGTGPLQRWLSASYRVQPPTATTGDLLIHHSDVSRVWVIETAATAADAAERLRFITQLCLGFAETRQGRYAPDLSAARKDRLDPSYSHPQYRIIVRQFERRGKP